jgi:hypothetical protein
MCVMPYAKYDQKKKIECLIVKKISAKHIILLPFVSSLIAVTIKTNEGHKNPLLQ